MKTAKREDFTIVREDRYPEMSARCPSCHRLFFVSPHTEEGLYLGADRTLRFECLHCGLKEEDDSSDLHICSGSEEWYGLPRTYERFKLCGDCWKIIKHSLAAGRWCGKTKKLKRTVWECIRCRKMATRSVEINTTNGWSPRTA